MSDDASHATLSETPDPRVDACERIRRHLERGAPWDACDAFRDANGMQSDDPDLLYWGALAHARVGATQQAHLLLDRARDAAAGAASDRLADIASLRGRLWKDAFERAAADQPAAIELARRARDNYLEAFALSDDIYPAVNAATLSLLLGDAGAARDLASRIVTRLERQPSRSAWDHATAGEAWLLLGRQDAARDSYVAGHRAAQSNAGNVAAMRRQVALIARAMPETADVLDVLRVPDVVAFAGHMLDAPDREEPRFPGALVPAVREAVREHLSRLHAPIIYSSAACGADLILIEAALDTGAEVNVVLPFDRDDFVRTSVRIGGDGWQEKFAAALSRAARVIMATEENYLGDDVLFEHAAVLLEGFAVLRAAQLCTTPQLLCVIDAGSSGGLGGTRASVERWQRRIGSARMVDLRGLREGHGREERVGRADAAPRSPASMPPPDVRVETIAAEARPPRTLKTMVFADFSGSSRILDAAAPRFQETFWKIGAKEIEACPVKPLFASTWGDALYAVFESPIEGAGFALRFLDGMREVDWIALGLADATPIRIALHAGPVFCGHDPIIDRDNYFGSSVTRAARIEPVTPAGMVYASEAFAATLAATGNDAFALEYVGLVRLAKDYGESRIYRLDRR